MSSRPREIVESDRYARERDSLGPDVSRLDEILHGVTWALARDPTIGFQIPGHGLWVYPTYPWPGAPGLAIYYTFDSQKVTLESIRPAVDAEEF